MVFDNLVSALRVVGALIGKTVLAVVLVTGWIGIPYVLGRLVWGEVLAPLYHRHFFWFVILLIPVAALFIKALSFFYDLLSGVGMAIGRVVDRIEGPTK